MKTLRKRGKTATATPPAEPRQRSAPDYTDDHSAARRHSLMMLGYDKGWMPGANWWRLLSDIDLKRHTPTGGWMAIHEYNPPRDEA